MTPGLAVCRRSSLPGPNPRVAMTHRYRTDHAHVRNEGVAWVITLLLIIHKNNFAIIIQRTCTVIFMKEVSELI